MIPEPNYTFKQYQQDTAKTAIYPMDCDLEYLSLGLCSEAGEVAGKVKKMLRDTRFYRDRLLDADIRQALSKEIGDVLWYISEISSALALPLGRVAEENIAKLADRASAGTLKGDGDDR